MNNGRCALLEWIGYAVYGNWPTSFSLAGNLSSELRPARRENHRGHPKVHELEPLIQIGEVKL